jgi:hypothetical protein
MRRYKMNRPEPVLVTAGQVQPGWQLFIDERWVNVGVVIETEASDGVRHITFVFEEDARLPAVKLRKDAAVKARPPDLPTAMPPVA